MSDSKTARASMVRETKEKHVETTEEAIKAIRDNRAGGLYIGDMSRVDKLLAAYDELQKRYTAMINEVKVEYHITEVPATVPAHCGSTLKVVMATIPNHELGHTDFGHDNTHQHHEGA